MATQTKPRKKKEAKPAAPPTEAVEEAQPGDLFEGTPEQLEQLQEVFASLQQDYRYMLLEGLSAPFHGSEVKTRTQGGVTLDYVSIDATINRFNAVLGPDWSFALVTPPSLIPLNDGKRYLATVHGRIDALGKIADGVGADVATDPDKAIKTALAEALKKAGHQFGVGLELWDPAARAKVALYRKAAAGDENALKQYVFELATDQAGERPKDKAAVATVFGVSESDLNDLAVLRRLAGIG